MDEDGVDNAQPGLVNRQLSIDESGSELFGGTNLLALYTAIVCSKSALGAEEMIPSLCLSRPRSAVLYVLPYLVLAAT